MSHYAICKRSLLRRLGSDTMWWEHVKDASHVDDIGTRAARRQPLGFRSRCRAFQFLLTLPQLIS